jgi:hypothetical protein
MRPLEVLRTGDFNHMRVETKPNNHTTIYLTKRGVKRVYMIHVKDYGTDAAVVTGEDEKELP